MRPTKVRYTDPNTFIMLNPQQRKDAAKAFDALTERARRYRDGYVISMCLSAMLLAAVVILISQG